MFSTAKEKTKLILFGDPNRAEAVEAQLQFTDFIRNKAHIVASSFEDCCTADPIETADFAVVFGGDGTILSAARTLAQTNIPVIGVNVGRLGFLAEFNINDLKELFDRIIADRSLLEKRMLLKCDIFKGDKLVFTSKAVNDVVITAGQPFRMIELQMCVKCQPLASCIGDGVIVSTPTGSTAYNLSAGGPILSANLAAMVITPVSPHSLSFRPIVIDASNTIEIKPIRTNKGTTIFLDGQVSYQLDTTHTVSIKRDEGNFLVINNPKRTQWDTLASKLSWAEKPRYEK